MPAISAKKLPDMLDNASRNVAEAQDAIDLIEGRLDSMLDELKPLIKTLRRLRYDEIRGAVFTDEFHEKRFEPPDVDLDILATSLQENVEHMKVALETTETYIEELIEQYDVEADEDHG